MFAQSEFGGDEKQQREKQRHAGYFGEIFIMAAGALFLAFNLAPTDEIMLIGHQMSPWHSIAMVVVSLLVMHAFVYSVEFLGSAPVPQGASRRGIFVRYTVVGYAIVMLMSAYVLWTFGRTDGLPIGQVISPLVVLGFPSAVGAAAARLIL
jgi:putative integral membrane protein (TIGR02587 family)